MKRRKKFLALSLVATMFLGGIINPETMVVRAEEAQVQQDVSVSGNNTYNQEPITVSEGDTNQSVGVVFSSDDSVPVEEGSLDFTALANGNTVISAGTYGNAVVSVVFTSDVDYATGSKNGYTSNVKFKKNGSVTVADGVVTAEGALKFVSKKDAEISIFMDKTSNVIHMMTLENGQLVGEQVGEAIAASGSTECTLQIEANKEYYFWAEGAKVKLWNIGYKYQGEAAIDFPDEPVPAFPGAEGGGKYATGGRGGEVYVVTNLNDSGEGSLRYGVETAPANGRIIVFDVGGTINLKSTLSFKQKKNITIAGQTAPGDGITIAGFDTNISDSENIVIRFVRFRVGSDNLLSGGDSMDALWGRDNDTFIIDHCTFSWNTDETLSTYRGKNGTVQWCIISESLTISGHSKGRHGYGGINGGDDTVFQYNLLANHTSRNPRIGGGSMTDPTSVLSYATLQLSNNVVYNYGYYPCYGGGYAYTNYINNYVKPGQGTRESLLEDTLIHVGESGKDGGFYVNGNILEGNDAVTANNALGIKEDAEGYISDAPYTPSEENPDAFSNITLRSAADAYDLVLNNAGAIYPYRDAVDARVVAQVKTDTGSYINTPDEVGGYPVQNSAREEGFDTDNDGIPDEWEVANGLNPNDATDSAKPASDTVGDPNYGYAWVEVYFNELVEDVVVADYVAPNPTVSIDLEDNALVDEGTDVTVTATASANNGGSIAKVEFYNGSELVGTTDGANGSYTFSGLADGTYHISVRAYDNDGNATQSNTSRLHINATAGTGDWTSTDVGQPGVEGTASLVDGVLTVKGAGKLGKSEGSVEGSDLNNAATDDFQFVYQEMTGDVEIVAKLDSYIAVDNHTFNGLMFRESLDEDAAAVAVGLTMTKIYDGDDYTWAAIMVNRPEKGGDMSVISESIDSEAGAAEAGISLIHGLNFKVGNTFNGTWMKITRIGDVFTAAISEDGAAWQTVGRMTLDLPETTYVGFAVEAGKAANKLENYATAKFSDIVINKNFGTITYDLENVDFSGADQFALGDDIVITLTNTKGYLLPDAVEVTVGGVAVDAPYDKEAGTITLENLQGDVVVKAQGIKRIVENVTFEEVDANDLLTVEEKDDKIILTQIAESGNIGQVGTAAVNQSYILFPEVEHFHEFSMDIKVTKIVGTTDRTGVFVGAFALEQGAFNSFAFRPTSKPAEDVAPFWTKAAGNAGNGSPKTAMVLDEVYNIQFTSDSSNQYVVKVVYPDGSKNSKTFKSNETYLKAGDAVRYGIGLVGATVEVTNMKLVDHEGNVIYQQASIEPAADYSAVEAAIQKANALNAKDFESFDAVTAALDAVVLGLTAADQDKVDAMAKAIEDAIAALVKVQVSQIVKVEPSETIDEKSVMTEAVKKATGATTVEELKKYLQDKLVKDNSDFANAKSVVWDVAVMVSLDNGNTWIKATEDNFPKEGVDVILPYPEGTNKDAFDFVVSHLVTMNCNGQTPGMIEYPAIEKTADGLKMHIMSASPFTIAWKEITKVEDNNTDVNDDDDDDDSGESLSTTATKTGDNMNTVAVIWAIVLLIAVAAVGMLCFRKRRLNGDSNE